MGAAGFELPLRSRPSKIDVEMYGGVWSEVVALLQERLADQLTEVEAELLETADELIEWPCDLPEEGIDFLFAEHEVVAAAAGLHWFLAAVRTHQADVAKVLAGHGYVADFSGLGDLADGVVLAFPAEGAYDALLIYPEHPEEVGVGDGAVAVAELSATVKAVVAAALAEGCQCSLCRASG